MSWAAVGVGVGTAVVGAGASIFGGQKAAGAAKDGAQRAEGVQRAGAGASLALQRPGLEVGTSALGMLADMFGLARPEPIDFDSIQRSIAPSTDNLVPVPGRPDRYADPRTGQGYAVARQGGNAGQLVQVGERFDNLIQPQQQGGGPRSSQQSQQRGNFTGINDLINNNPGIRHVREQGEQAIARGAAARGLNASGGALQDLSTFNSGQAATNYQSLVLNPLFQLAGFGPQAASNSGSIIQGGANNIGNLQMGAADARGSAFQNTGNVIGNTLSDIGGGIAMQGLLRRERTQGGNNGGGGGFGFGGSVF